MRGYGEGAVGSGRSCLVANSELTIPLVRDLIHSFELVDSRTRFLITKVQLYSQNLYARKCWSLLILLKSQIYML